MIQQFKKYLSAERMSTKSFIAVILFGAIILVFVFFGLPTHQPGSLGGYAARVNDKYISLADLREEVTRREQYYRQFGGMFDGPEQRRSIREESLNILVERELLNQTAKKNGIQVSDAEVRDFIVKDIVAFQKDGQFAREIYRGYLDQSGQTAGEFEDRIRQDLRSQRSIRAFEVLGTPSALELSQQNSLKQLKLNVSFLKIEKTKLTDGTLPIDPVLSSQVDTEVGEKLKNEDFVKRAKADYEANISQYEKPEEVRASHILVRIDEKTTEAQALDKIKLAQKRSAQEDFGKVASEMSDDPGSKAKKGDLGFFSRGMMVPEFDQVVFSLAPGKLSEPFKSQFGYHLVKVTGKKPAEKTEFEKAQTKIARKLILADRFEEDMKKLEAAVSAGSAEGIETFLKTWKISWSETGPFDLSQDFVAALSSSAASQAAFELSPSKPLLNRIVRDGESQFILKWKSIAKDPNPVADLASVSQANQYLGMNLLSKWIESQRKTAKIEKNPSVLTDR